MKKTIIDQIEILQSGFIHIRFALLVLDDDGSELARQWHRTVIEPGGDVDAQIGLVNSHLSAMGKMPVEPDRISELKAICALVHTPDRVARYQANVAA